MRLSGITRILLKTHRAEQLSLALVGSLIGLLLVLVASDAFLDFKKLLHPQEGESIGSHFLVIHKKVSLLNAVNADRSAFTAAELAAIRATPSIRKAAPFIPNQFEAVALLQLGNAGIDATLHTDIFLESVQDSFIDVQTSEWHWEEESPTVPVIIPADFIHLYNFTYAPARGLPQLSKKTLELFSFKILIRKEGASYEYRGRIVGFSDRISSMIVPETFMAYANRTYAPQGAGGPRYFRVITEVDPIQYAAFRKFLLDNAYETNEELLKSARFASLMQAILFVVGLLGLVMIATAFSALMLYIQLVIQRSKYELETLLMAGANHGKLIRWYALGVLFLLLSLLFVDIGILWMLKRALVQYLHTVGFDLPTYIDPLVVFAAVAITFILFLTIWMLIRKLILQLALPGQKGNK